MKPQKKKIDFSVIVKAKEKEMQQSKLLKPVVKDIRVILDK